MPAPKQPLPVLVPPEQHIQIGAIVFPQMDQMDLTGPFAVLSRLPNSSFQLLWKNAKPVAAMFRGDAAAKAIQLALVAVSAEWDNELANLMARVGRCVHEESLLKILLSDLRQDI